MFRSNNPALRSDALSREMAAGYGETMTIQGTVNKAFVLFFLVLLSASWVWSKAFAPAPMFEDGVGQALTPSGAAAVAPFVWGGSIAALIIYFITVFNMRWVSVTAPIYAVCEGLAIGGLSAMFEAQFPGIVVQAVGLTFGTLFCMLAVYRSGLIKVDQKFMIGLSAAVGAIFFIYVLSIILSFFHVHIPLIFGSGPIGIGFSFVVVGIAAFCLLADFHVIENLSRQGAPRYMEWYGAFALMVTLIWLYLEILRLLSKMRERR